MQFDSPRNVDSQHGEQVKPSTLTFGQQVAKRIAESDFLYNYEKPNDRFITYEESDREWAEYFGIVKRRPPAGATIFVHPKTYEAIQRSGVFPMERLAVTEIVDENIAYAVDFDAYQIKDMMVYPHIEEQMTIGVGAEVDPQFSFKVRY